VNRGLLARLLICIATLGLFLFAYLNQAVAITQVRLQIPHLAKDVNMLIEELRQLRYEIERFENPVHLMELAREPQFGHLRYPLCDEIYNLGDLRSAFGEE